MGLESEAAESGLQVELTAAGEMGSLGKLRGAEQGSEPRAPSLYPGGPQEEAEPAWETEPEEPERNDEAKRARCAGEGTRQEKGRLTCAQSCSQLRTFRPARWRPWVTRTREPQRGRGA